MSISLKYQKDYKNADFHNPRLQKEKDTQRKISKILLKFFILIVALGSFYTIFFSPYFRIQEVSFSGVKNFNHDIVADMINQYRDSRKFYIFSRNNYWMFDKDELKNILQEKFWIDYIDMKKIWPNIIVLDVGERESAINWVSGDKCFRLDLTGTAIAPCTDSAAMLTISDKSILPIEIGKRMIEKQELDELIKIDQSMKIIGEGFHFNLANYEKNEKSLELKTADGFSVFFNLAQPADTQIERLELLMKQNDILTNLSKLQYIDLRFGDKLFYK